MMSRNEEELHVYMADRDLPGITMEQLAQAQQAAIETSQRFTAEGKPVRYIRSTYIPGESRVMCLFEAPAAALVKEVNEAAHIPYTRVVEALDLTP
jgi:hypothetical protein